VTGTRPDGTEVTFETDAEVTIGALDSEVEVACTAAATGRTGNVPAGTLTEIAGLPDGYTVSQEDRAAGGSDEETDDQYRARYILLRQGQGNGRLQDLKAAALGNGGVTYAAIDESFIADEDGGYVAIYVGDPDAAGSSELVQQ